MHRLLSTSASDRDGIKTTGKKLVFLFVSLTVVISGILYLGNLFSVKHSEIHYRDFMESDQSYDVLFFGSSHMINAMSPNDLYHEYGIRSYNLSMHGNYLKSNYYLMQECLDILDKSARAYPEVIVVDVFNGVQLTGDLHNAWDSLPLNRIKVSMIQDMAEQEKRMGLYFPFSIYHSRWNDIAITDYEIPYNKILGFEPGNGIYEFEDEYELTPESDKRSISEEEKDIIDKMQEFCDRKGIRLILIFIPDRYRYDLRYANTVKDHAQEKNIDFVNFAYEGESIDYDKDFFDGEGHLNLTGARKITSSMGAVLRQYGIEDRRGDSNSKIWDDYYEYYLEEVQRRIDGSEK